MKQPSESDRIVPLVMCGGAGTRLWPSSREGRPKQFLSLLGARSTFQDTMLRVSDAAVFARPIVITNTAYRFMVRSSSRRSESRPISCSSRCGAIPGRRLPLALPLAKARWRPRDDGARRRSRGCAMARPLSPLASKRAKPRSSGHIVTFGVKPDRRGDRIWLYSPRRKDWRRRIRGRTIRRKARCRRLQSAISEKAISGIRGNFIFRAGDLLDEYQRVRTRDGCSIESGH